MHTISDDHCAKVFIFSLRSGGPLSTPKSLHHFLPSLPPLSLVPSLPPSLPPSFLSSTHPPPFPSEEEHVTLSLRRLTCWRLTNGESCCCCCCSTLLNLGAILHRGRGTRVRAVGRLVGGWVEGGGLPEACGARVTGPGPLASPGHVPAQSPPPLSPPPQPAALQMLVARCSSSLCQLKRDAVPAVRCVPSILRRL